MTDSLIDPPDRPRWTVEAPLRLPTPFCCYSPPEDAADVSPLPALRAGVPTFGSFHKLPKLNHQVIDLWSALLRAVPVARLLLFRDSLNGRRGQELKRDFEARGIAPGRIQLAHDWSARDHWRMYLAIDLTLDVFPWCGHTTACESLWMGVPVVTLMGERRSSRLTASVLTSIGLTDLIAETHDQYIDAASRCVSNLDELACRRASLRETMRGSPLCDGPSFTRHLEAAYDSLWNRRHAESGR